MARLTIDQAVELSGVGLHTGAPVRLVCRPGESGQGIVFRRVDLPHTPRTRATLRSVCGTDRCTTLGEAGARVQTVEHLLAAVLAEGLDDLLVELDGPEVPAGDGSFAPFTEALRRAGTRELAGEAVTFRVRTPFRVTEGSAEYQVEVADRLRVTCSIDWAHGAIGRQRGTFGIDPETFASEIAAARTFGFLSEAASLRAQGLALGASESNAIVLDEYEVRNGPLRWPDEFVRHKTGDLVGDLALLGGRIAAHVIAMRPSHTGNVALARAIARAAQRSGGTVLDIAKILDVLPHRYPFLLVDRILEIEGDKRIVGIKNVTINEPFFQGHFPGHPIMPGVLIVEAMAQVGGMLLMGAIEDPASKVVYFMSLDNVKFRRPVVPGDQLRLEVEMLQIRGHTCRMRGEAFVDGQLAAEAEMMARVMDR